MKKRNLDRSLCPKKTILQVVFASIFLGNCVYSKLLYGLAISIALSSLYFFNIRIAPGDILLYRKLIQDSLDLHAHGALERSPVTQKRRGVRKDIWTIKEGQRVHSCVLSATSEINLKQKKEKIEATEILTGVEAWIEADQEIRHLSANGSKCYYPSCIIAAEDLAADFGAVKCRGAEVEWRKEAIEFSKSFQLQHAQGLLSGEKAKLTEEGQLNRLHIEEDVFFKAEKNPFSISSRSATAFLPKTGISSKHEFQEIHFLEDVEIQTLSEIKATGGSAHFGENTLRLLPAPGSTCSMSNERCSIFGEEIRFDREKNELICFTPEGNLKDKKTEFSADIGRVDFKTKNFQAQTLILEGDVKIASLLEEKESFALADSATFRIKDKKMTLQSCPETRVLFRQEGLEISAPTVHIQDAIQGFGDVRCFFYPEEKIALDKIFKTYL